MIIFAIVEMRRNLKRHQMNPGVPISHEPVELEAE